MKNKSDLNTVSQIDGKKAKRKKIMTVLLVVFIVIPLIIAAISIGGFAIWANTQNVDESLLPTASAVPVFYDANGNELAYAESNYVETSEISDDLKYAFVALEDKRFYKHDGYDVTRIAGATLHNIKAGKIREGASTITQQLIKNTHLTHERTMSRKLKELALAAKLEKKYDKDEILAMYLSVIYFGSGAYGVKQAANVYFDKDISNLTLAECATLAGIVRNPAKYSPIKNPEESKKRRNVALDVMREQGYIDDDRCENAKSAPIRTAGDNDFDSDSGLSAKACAFYIEQAAKEVCEALNITKYQLSNSGLKIYTNLDANLQRELEAQTHLRDNFENDSVGSVSIVIDNVTGAVIAYSSSYPYAISRQAGSVLKPLAVYAPAIDGGLVSLATPVVDESIDFNGFSPKNYGGIYYGDTDIREAMKKSMNSVSVKVLDYLGVEKSAAYLNNFGIETSEQDKNYALALGATLNGVSPLSVACGYSALARGGERVTPSFVRYAVKDGGKILSNENEGVKGTQSRNTVVSKTTSALITSALVDTVRDGTAKTLSVLPFEVASKTGTVERAGGGNSDAWNASYNDDYTVVVWHGTDDVANEKGGGLPTRHALKIWRALDGFKNVSRTIAPCEDIVETEIDLYSTRCNKRVTAASENTPLEYRKLEYFAPNNLPSVEGGKFDGISKVDFEIQNENGVIRLSFDSESIYAYEVYRTDVTGNALIFANAGDGEKISIIDRPIAFSSKVDYTVICHLLNNEEISSSATKSAYISGFEWD